MRTGMGRKNALADVDITVATPPPKLRQKRQRIPIEAGRTRSAQRARQKKGRKVAAMPKNKSLAEIEEMDPDSPEFRHHSNSPRKQIDENSHWMDVVRRDKQDRSNARKAAVRKWEAKVQKAQEVLTVHASSKDMNERDLYDDDRLIAEGMLNMDDWTDEELIRGYRKNRNGKFGKPPRYIPREVQLAAFRALVGRGDRNMKLAYLESVAELIKLAQNASSEKVRLEAIKELQNRVVGKVPDRVHVAQEQPWEGILADSLIPIGEALPIDLEDNGTGVFALPAGFDGSEGEVDAVPSASAAEVQPVQRNSAPSPSRRIVQEVRRID